MASVNGPESTCCLSASKCASAVASRGLACLTVWCAGGALGREATLILRDSASHPDSLITLSRLGVSCRNLAASAA